MLTIRRRSLAHHITERRGFFLSTRRISPGLRALILVGHAQPHLPRQIGDGFTKTGAGVFGQEFDGVAADATAEAVIELLARTDRKARRFFAMERTQTHVVGAGLFERDMASDQLDDVDARQQLLNETGRDHATRRINEAANR